MADSQKVSYFNAEQFQQIQPEALKEHQVEVYQFLAQVYLWMLVGLMVSFLSGYLLSLQKDVVAMVQGNHSIPFFMMMFQFQAADMYRRFKDKLNPWTCTVMFILYALTTGMTFAFAFITFKMDNMITLFFITSMMFVLLVVSGFLIKREIPILAQASMMGGSGMLMLFLLQTVMHLEVLQLAISGIVLLMITNSTMSVAREIQKTVDKGFDAGQDKQQMTVDWALRMYTSYMGMFTMAMHVLGVRRQS
jgi:FtsH-binding integral membrane protein